MYLSLEKSDLYDYVKKQISYFFPDGKNSFNDDVKKAFATALDRVENCFCVINNKAYSDESNNAYFSHLH